MSPAFRDGDRLRYGPEEIAAAAAAIRSRSPLVPRVALVLGSGLGGYADGLADRIEVGYAAIPGFPVSTVPGHAGMLVLGRAGGAPVVALKGRFHVYEGYSAAQVTFPLRVMHALGARVYLVTNAAGGINPRMRPGDFMLIEDQINMQFRSPLRGSGPLVAGSRFVDMGRPFSGRLLDVARGVAARLGLEGVHFGTYFGNLGPAYETPAEIAMARRLGGDAVGMSTTPEVIVAAHLGMEALGITCISNLAAGLSPTPLTHDEVMETTARQRGAFTRLLDALIPQL